VLRQLRNEVAATRKSLESRRKALRAIAIGRLQEQPQENAQVQGLSKSDRAIFFHLCEGSELIPLAWVRAVKSIRTSRPFLELPERSGLLPSPENGAVLPIVVTAAPSRGAEVRGP